jgi:hypothetical protein
MNGKVTLRLTNRLNEPRTLILEPWTTEYTLQAGDSIEILAEGDLSLPLEVEVDSTQWTLYSFDSKGALLTVTREPGRVG